jgi:hypothetical protein
MNKFRQGFFENKAWSTASVFRDTIDDLEHHHLKYWVLPKLRDVDHAEDLVSLEQSISQF